LLKEIHKLTIDTSEGGDMKTHRYVFLMGLLLIVESLSVVAGQDKKRLALLDFDFGTVQQWWSGDWDVGKGIADLVVTSLVKDGTFSIIERKKLDAVLEEQNFSNSDRATPASAAQIGKVLGVNAIVVGSITQFGMEKKSTNVGGILGRVTGVSTFDLGKTKGIATVVIDARIVDVNTGEILMVMSGKGVSSRSGLLLAGGGESSGGIEMGSSDFQDTILGEATRAAVQDLTTQLVSQADKVRATQVVISGMVADVAGNTVIINIGRGGGVSVGMRLSVERLDREVKDPSTGQVIRKITTPVGEIEVTEVDEGSAVAKLVSGQGLKVGDIVKNK
jgi:curli biogenesis system outer membrane secretion channel CsgG